MESIKPIETYYNGYRFRSRLEARWAVFFDAIGVKYDYEPEGFRMSDGSKYLPDFFLPELNYYIEVKGMNDHLRNDIDRLVRFVLEAKTAVMIMSDIPYDPHAKGLFWFPILYFVARRGGGVDGRYAFFQTYDINPIETVIQDDFYVGMNKYFLFRTGDGKELFDKIQAISGSELDEDRGPTIKSSFDLSQVEKALITARQARFEHGETPRI